MTEHPSATLARTLSEALANQDMDAVASCLADDVVLHFAGSNPLAGDYDGREGFFGFMGRAFELTRGTLRLEPVAIMGTDGWACEWERVTASVDGRHLDQQSAAVYRIDDGRIREIWLRGDPDATDAFFAGTAVQTNG